MKNQKRFFTGLFFLVLFCIITYNIVVRFDTNVVTAPMTNSLAQETAQDDENSLEISGFQEESEPHSNEASEIENTDITAEEEIQTLLPIEKEKMPAEDQAPIEGFPLYTFRSQDLYDQHYRKHGSEFGEITQEEYNILANRSIASEKVLKKTESDGDLLFYELETNTFTVLSKDGFIRTCFKPDDGIDYWNRQ